MQGTLSTILVVRLSSVGDIVLATPLLRSLRRRFPAARIDFLVKAEYAPLLAASPDVDRVLPFPGWGPASLLGLRRSVRAARYDLIVDIHDSLRSRVLTFAAPGVVRYRKRRLPRFVLVHFKRDLYRWFGGAPGVAERYLEAVRPLGAVGDGLGPEIRYAATAASRAAGVLGDAGVEPGVAALGVCPSARHFTKRWPAEGFAAAAAEIAGERGWPVLLFGSADERDYAEAIARDVRSRQPRSTVVNLAGSLSLDETAAAMDRCALVLCNDTGLMHIAAARRRPVVAVFGCTTRQLGFFPAGTAAEVVENDGLPCRPCTHIGRAACPEGHFLCMRGIPVERVTAAARRLVPAPTR